MPFEMLIHRVLVGVGAVFFPAVSLVTSLLTSSHRCGVLTHILEKHFAIKSVAGAVTALPLGFELSLSFCGLCSVCLFRRDGCCC